MRASRWGLFIAVAASLALATAGPAMAQSPYVIEHDPRFGDPTFDPFVAARKGFDYLDCVTF